ncbi:MAG TPA: SDR family NAD(P)-dependent oxidoreductase [Anaerolineaceae bacterium]|nr:SDR family NAD(P)-dependent oxidoreductase [Anaerolineaceae bacterium]
MVNDLMPSPRNIFITGCSSGIGLASATYLAQNGFTVFASVRKAADADRLRSLQEPNLIPICPLDLTRPEDIPLAVDQVRALLNRLGQDSLYALINNAGGGSVAPLELMDPEIFRQELLTRLAGPVALVQALLPLLRQGHGRIVWISTPGTIPTPYVASIHACDFATNCIARTLEIELKPWGIPCIQVRCGGIKTTKGLQTTTEAAAILQHPRGDLYRERLDKWARDMAEFDEKRTEPEQVARLVGKVLLTSHPRRRYSIGHMSTAAAFLEILPQSLTDAILKARF